MNLVERFFRDLTVDCVRDGSFTSVGELVASIETYPAQRSGPETIRLESRGTGNPQENPTSQGRPRQSQRIEGIMNSYLPSGTLAALSAVATTDLFDSLC